MWIIIGRRMGTGRTRRGLEIAATQAGIGHVTPEMPLRYAHLASDTIRAACDNAIARTPAGTRYIADPERRGVLADQLADIITLRDDAQQRR